MDKKILRQNMLQKRNALLENEKQQLTNQIMDHVLNSNFYQMNKNICIYQAFRNEVSCEKIVKNAYRTNKNIFVPVTNLNSKTIEFYQVTKDTKWKMGAYGIQEPILSDISNILHEKACIFMPGLVFDLEKHRIGYGGGYYDKYLSKHTEHITCALCFDFQVINDKIPYESHDILPNYIITDKRII